nr:hypothetical protein HUO10_005669 [Paraburkholderia busanensis]
MRAALGASLRIEQIASVASIDSKAHEAGLLEFCARHALPLVFFSREQIAALPVSTASAAAQAHLGVDGVCEPCALLAAGDGARLVAGKTIHEGVTVAIAISTRSTRSAISATNAAALHPQDPS